MGNCHKTRLCKFLHSHCPSILFNCYQTLAIHCHCSDSDIDDTINANNSHSSRTSTSSHNRTQTVLDSTVHKTTTPTTTEGYCDYHQRYYMHPSSSSSTSDKHSPRVQRLQPQSSTSSFCDRLNCRARSKMHRQRSASHCPHQVHNKDRKCCCRKGQIYDPLTMVSPVAATVGQSKRRASSLRVLNKRFNFPYFDTNNNSGSTNGSQNSQLQSNHQISGGGNSILRRNSRKHKHPKLNELVDRCLLEIFEYLTLQERLHCRRVCRRWQHLIKQSLQTPASLKIGEHSVKCNCQCAHFPSWDLPPSKRVTRDNAGYILFPNKILLTLLTLCSNLRCINFSHCYLNDQSLKVSNENPVQFPNSSVLLP